MGRIGQHGIRHAGEMTGLWGNHTRWVTEPEDHAGSAVEQCVGQDQPVKDRSPEQPFVRGGRCYCPVHNSFTAGR